MNEIFAVRCFHLSSPFSRTTLFSFQVFAPTDEAFAALPAERLEFLKSPEGKEELVALLQYHVVESVIPSAAIGVGSTAVDSVHGGQLTVTRSAGGEISVSDVVVVSDSADILASNGIVHVIDTVLTIPEDMDDTPLDTTSSAVSFWTQMGAGVFIAISTVVALV